MATPEICCNQAIAPDGVPLRSRCRRLGQQLVHGIDDPVGRILSVARLHACDIRRHDLPLVTR